MLFFPSSLTVNLYAWQMNDSAAQRFYSIPACLAWTLLGYTNPSTIVSENVTWISERTYLKISCYQVRMLRKQVGWSQTVCSVRYRLRVVVLSLLVPRGRAPFGQHQESRPLARSNDILLLNGFVNTIDWDHNQSDLSDLTLNMRRVTAVRESRTSGVRLGQRSRFLVLTKRSAASGDENDKSLKTNEKCSWVIRKVVTVAYRSGRLREIFITKFKSQFKMEFYKGGRS